ncbi:MAG: DUF4405 domain-containing protein [Candidatus Dadabacteria bacterium]|nr:DUF4405 domain-containing protein [Candidatus Dadabacteria bacterium]
MKTARKAEAATVYNENPGTYLGYIVIAALVAACVLAAWTGFMLSIAPYSTGGGDTLLFGLTRGEWQGINSWLSVAAITAVPAAIIAGWKSFG